MGLGRFGELHYLVLICPIKLARMMVILDDQRSCVAEICSRTSFDAALEPIDFIAFIPGADIYALIKARDDVAVEFPGRQTKRLEIRTSENLLSSQCLARVCEAWITYVVGDHHLNVKRKVQHRDVQLLRRRQLTGLLELVGVCK
jgi:hypothetical protein